jgi:hypothetical protein
MARDTIKAGDEVAVIEGTASVAVLRHCSSNTYELHGFAKLIGVCGMPLDVPGQTPREMKLTKARFHLV